MLAFTVPLQHTLLQCWRHEWHSAVYSACSDEWPFVLPTGLPVEASVLHVGALGPTPLPSLFLLRLSLCPSKSKTTLGQQGSYSALNLANCICCVPCATFIFFLNIRQS